MAINATVDAVTLYSQIGRTFTSAMVLPTTSTSVVNRFAILREVGRAFIITLTVPLALATTLRFLRHLANLHLLARNIYTTSDSGIGCFCRFKE
jgi:hypothetical protein